MEVEGFVAERFVDAFGHAFGQALGDIVGGDLQGSGRIGEQLPGGFHRQGKGQTDGKAGGAPRRRDPSSPSSTITKNVSAPSRSTRTACLAATMSASAASASESPRRVPSLEGGHAALEKGNEAIAYESREITHIQRSIAEAM